MNEPEVISDTITTVSQLESSGASVLNNPLYIKSDSSQAYGTVYFPVYSTIEHLICIDPNSSEMKFTVIKKDAELASVMSNQTPYAKAEYYVSRKEDFLEIRLSRAKVLESVSKSPFFLECMSLFPNETIQVLNGDMDIKDLAAILELETLTDQINTLKSNISKLGRNARALVSGQDLSYVSQLTEALKRDNNKLQVQQSEKEKRQRFIQLLQEVTIQFNVGLALTLVSYDNTRILEKENLVEGTIIESEAAIIPGLVAHLEYNGELIRGIIVGARKIKEGIVPVFSIEGEGYNLGYSPSMRIISFGLDPEVFEKIKSESMFIKARVDLEIRRYNEISTLFGFNFDASRQLRQLFLLAYDDPSVQAQLQKIQCNEASGHRLARDFWTMISQAKILEALTNDLIEGQLAIDLIKILNEVRKNH